MADLVPPLSGGVNGIPCHYDGCWADTGTDCQRVNLCNQPALLRAVSVIERFAWRFSFRFLGYV